MKLTGSKIVVSAQALTNDLLRRLLIFLCGSIFSCHQVHSQSDLEFESPPQIVGGEPARPTEFPEFAALKIYPVGADRPGLCSATMIASNKALTAGHCIEALGSDSRFTVIPGYFDQPIREESDFEVAVSEVHVHPDYSEDLLGIENDIAVVTLETDVNSRVASVLIGNKPLENQPAIGAGLGLVDYEEQILPSVLQKFRTTIPSNETCNNDPLSGLYYDRTLICVSPRFSPAVPCFGDSGGPLLVKTGGRRAVAGVASVLDSFCVTGTTFAAYTRVTEYTDFIKRHSPNSHFLEIGESPTIAPILNVLLGDDKG